MKYELKESNNNLTFGDLESGDIFICKTCSSEFLAMKLVCADGNEYIVNFEDDNAYSDIDNYEIIRLVNVEFIEVSQDRLYELVDEYNKLEENRDDRE